MDLAKMTLNDLFCNDTCLKNIFRKTSSNVAKQYFTRRATLTVGLAKESHIEHPRRADPRADPRAQEKKEIVPQNEVQ